MLAVGDTMMQPLDLLLRKILSEKISVIICEVPKMDTDSVMSEAEKYISSTVEPVAVFLQADYYDTYNV